ncbi:MAG: hypothetical protein AAGD25_16910 [Cyanobacteria bacterium P01_F01_bin.150]
MAATRTVRLIDSPPHRAYSARTIAHLVMIAVGNQLERWFNPAEEPTIVKRNNKYNIPYWEVHNPVTKRTVYCASEVEVNLWLEHMLCR